MTITAMLFFLPELLAILAIGIFVPFLMAGLIIDFNKRGEFANAAVCLAFFGGGFILVFTPANYVAQCLGCPPDIIYTLFLALAAGTLSLLLIVIILYRKRERSTP